MLIQYKKPTTFQWPVHYYLGVNHQIDHDKPAQTAFDHPVTNQLIDKYTIYTDIWGLTLTPNQSHADQWAIQWTILDIGLILPFWKGKILVYKLLQNVVQHPVTASKYNPSNISVLPNYRQR